ncbi:uncharacterized protein LOC129595312 isoform X1 [Paramacrobiotus metropolitanus]|uniref:uncharacterized protein LOC129595312 isoform X1 n=1 Tax=Paramacrobiotus metropolitanus TaxID=2943436 RepID=UPI002445ECF6|nr:uncharacterized protein LOC129595312 isoform X1 [Paramacrobiotus metropolitanus]
MVRTKTCSGNAMIKSGRTWVYDAIPVVERRWNQFRRADVVTCLLENVTLETTCDDCPVLSATGEISSSILAESSIHPHVTYVWTTDKNHTKCRANTVLNSEGQLFQLKSGEIHIRDHLHQLSFTVEEKMERTCDEGASVHYVRSHPTLRIKFYHAWYRPNVTEKIRPPARPPVGIQSRLNANLSAEIATLLSSHLQYVEDFFAFQEMKIFNHLHKLQCQADKTEMENLILLSQFSPVVVGTKLGFPKCQAAVVLGDSATIYQCTEVNVTIGVKYSTCGPDPYIAAENDDRGYTVALDGETLKRHSVCLHRHSVVIVHGTLYRYQDGAWTPVNPIFHKTLAHWHYTAKFLTDNLEDTLGDSLSVDPFRFLDLTAELSGLMLETGISNLSTIITPKYVQSTMKSMTWHSLLNISFTSITVFIAIVFCVRYHRTVIAFLSCLIDCCRPRSRRQYDFQPRRQETAAVTVAAAETQDRNLSRTVHTRTVDIPMTPRYRPSDMVRQDPVYANARMVAEDSDGSTIGARTPSPEHTVGTRTEPTVTFGNALMEQRRKLAPVRYGTPPTVSSV